MAWLHADVKANSNVSPSAELLRLHRGLFRDRPFSRQKKELSEAKEDAQEAQLKMYYSYLSG